MAQTKYQTNPGSIRNANFVQNPLSTLTVVSQGTVAKPVPVPKGTYKPKLVPSSVSAPGASGTI